MEFQQDGNTWRDNPMMSDIEITWRWGNSRSMAPASGEPCNRVQGTVAGRDVPSYILSRHPVHNSFLMQSCWALYTAFTMPKPGEDVLMDDEALEVGFSQQSSEALLYNLGVTGAEVFVEEGPGEEEERVVVSVVGTQVQVRACNFCPTSLCDRALRMWWLLRVSDL